MRLRSRFSLLAIASMIGVCLAPAWGDSFSFSTGLPDGKVGALSAPAGPGNLETETADDFLLSAPTVISRATMHGLLPPGTPASHVTRVEVEIYRIFPRDSNTTRTITVPTRVNSPSDVEFDAGTRDSKDGTLSATTAIVSATFIVANTVVNGIHPIPNQLTHGEGPALGEEVEIDMTFNPPIFLPADHYFFRPEVQVTGGSFLFLSAPKPTSPALFAGDLQAWIRNSALAPDWLRIGSDIIGSGAFNMSFSLTGNTVPQAGTPGNDNCGGQTVSAIAQQFGGMSKAASSLGFSSVDALQSGIAGFCKP